MRIRGFANPQFFVFREALNESKCADWRADFSPDEGEKPQAYFVYGKVLRQNMTENPPSRRAQRFVHRFLRAIPHNAARADSEKNRVLMKAVFRRNTLCIARKSDEIRAQFFRKAPKTICAVLP